MAELIALANLRLPTLSIDEEYEQMDLEITTGWFATAIMAWREMEML